MRMNELLKEADKEINKADLLAVLLDNVLDKNKNISFTPWLDAITGMELKRTDKKGQVFAAPKKFNILWIIPVQRIQEENELEPGVIEGKFLKAIRPDVEKLLRGSEFHAWEDIEKQDELILKGSYTCESVAQYDVVKNKRREVTLQLVLEMSAKSVTPKDVSKVPYWAE